LRRVSRHNCLVIDRQDFQLQITELKVLYHRFHPKDKKLGQAFEKDWEGMFRDNRIHYEVSIIHTPINKSLEPNQDLELGEKGYTPSADHLPLDFSNMTYMLELTSLMISKMDWMGYYNIGTLPRLYAEQDAREYAHQQSLAPVGSRLGLGAQTVYRQTIATPLPLLTRTASTYGASFSNLRNRLRQVPGMRMGTLAEVFWEDGRFIGLGMGGAKVPIPPAEVANLGLVVPEEEGEEIRDGEGELGPDDSMSVAEVREQGQTGDWRRTGYVQQLEERRRGYDDGYGGGPGSEMPQGYW
jgi:hypothetical protein